MSRFASRALCVLAVVAVAAGCGGSEPQPGSSTPPIDTSGTAAEGPGAPKTALFVNSRENLTDARADHYVDFQFRYPDDWRVIQGAFTEGTPNFVKVERTGPDGTTAESFAAGWFAHAAAARGDSAALRAVLDDLAGQFSRAFAGFEKVSTGADSIASRRAPGFRFAFRPPPGAEVDRAWGRVVLVPTGGENGLVLVMFATPLAPGVTGAEDVGETAGLATILETLRLGATPVDRRALPDTLTPRDTDGAAPALEGSPNR